jgi:hypothetical protein
LVQHDLRFVPCTVSDRGGMNALLGVERDGVVDQTVRDAKRLQDLVGDRIGDGAAFQSTLAHRLSAVHRAQSATKSKVWLGLVEKDLVVHRLEVRFLGVLWKVFRMKKGEPGGVHVELSGERRWEGEGLELWRIIDGLGF